MFYLVLQGDDVHLCSKCCPRVHFKALVDSHKKKETHSGREDSSSEKKNGEMKIDEGSQAHRLNIATQNFHFCSTPTWRLFRITNWAFGWEEATV